MTTLTLPLQPLTKQDHVYFKVSRDTGVANNFSERRRAKSPWRMPGAFWVGGGSVRFGNCS